MSQEFLEDVGFESSDKSAQLPTSDVEAAAQSDDASTGRQVDAQAVDDAMPAQPEEPRGTRVDQGLESALKAEREKRQEMERRYHELATARSAPPAQPAPQKDDGSDREARERLFFDDPAGYTEKRAQEIAARVVAEREVRRSAARMAQEAPDYYQVIERFQEHANTKEPYLWAQLQNVDDPARAAYNYMKQLENPSSPVDIEKERERIREEEREKLRREMAGEAATRVPKSPATASGGGGAAPVARPHKTFDDLLDENDRLVG